MATVYGDFYDYNGVMFCHGIIKDTGSSVCDYVIMKVDDEYYYKAFIKDKENFPGIYNVNTYSHATGSAPKYLNSGTHTVYLQFYTSSGGVIAEGYLYSGSDKLDYRMHNTLYSPALSYDPDNKTITVTNQGTGRYFLEIRRRNHNKVKTDYTETEKDYFYTSYMRGTEGGKYNEGKPHSSMINKGYKDDDGNLYEPIPKARFQKLKTIPTIIVYDSEANFTSAEKNEYYSHACDTLDELQEITGKTFTLRNTVTRAGSTDFNACMDSDYNTYTWESDIEYRMVIRFGKENTMHLNGTQNGKPIIGGDGRAGYYLFEDPADGVDTSFAAIAVDAAAQNETLLHVIHEEIMQSLGMGNDSHSQETSLHWDPHWSNPESYVGIDKRLLGLICSEDVNGWSSFDFINNWDTPCILYKDYTGADLVFDVSQLSANEEYYAWAWIAREGTGGSIIGGSMQNTGGSTAVSDGWDDDPYSMRAQISFDTVGTNPYPGRFSWTYEKTKGGDYIMTAEEWNGFQEHIEKMLLYKLGSTQGYAPEDVAAGEIFSAAKYNTAGSAIKLIPGFGAFIPTVASGDEITADKSSTEPGDNIINIIVDELNEIT